MTRRLGRHHPIVGRLRALRRDGSRRAAERRLVAEGPHAVDEALRAGADIEVLVHSERGAKAAAVADCIARARQKGVDCVELGDAVVASLEDARSGQGLIALVETPSWPDDPLAGDGPPLVVVACGIQDPGNLGALLRTADAAGATAAVAVTPAADPHHPRAVRASAGAIFRLPVVRRSDALELAGWLAAGGVTSWATRSDAGVSYDACRLNGPTAVWFGNEGAGLPAEAERSLDRAIRVPLRPGRESLSVGAAAAVVLFEAARQRRERINDRSGDGE